MKKTEESCNIRHGLKKVLNFLKCLILPLIMGADGVPGAYDGGRSGLPACQSAAPERDQLLPDCRRVFCHSDAAHA